MNIISSLAIAAPWVVWSAYWAAKSRQVKTTVREEGSVPRRYQMILLTSGAALLVLPTPSATGLALDASAFGALQWAGFALIVAGLVFSAWARLCLGTNWSVPVTLKEGHEFVRSGPYTFVRHPLYSGCLLALAGSAIINGEWRGALGFALIFASLTYKIRVEETWLTAHFGEPYTRYRREVAALIPGIY